MGRALSRGLVTVTALVGVSVFQGVLKHDGVSLAIVYGIYPLTAQLIVLGAVGAAIAAAREEWPVSTPGSREPRRRRACPSRA